jgi:hypothetical protein
MPHAPGKFCIDRDFVRWTLIDGVINRKTNQDDPSGGQNLRVEQVRGIQKTTVKRKERQSLGRPLLLIAVLLLIAAWNSNYIALRFVMGLAGLACLYSGAERMRTKVRVEEAFRLVIPGRNTDEWTVVGVTSEIMGFLGAVEAEVSSQSRAAGA